MTISAEIEAEIRRLHYAEHWPIGTIVVTLGVHRDVVCRVIGLAGRPKNASLPRKRLKKLDAFAAFVSETLTTYPRLRATRIYDMITERGYRGSVRMLREHVKLVRPKRGKEAFHVIETLAGEQAQIDWGHVGSINVTGGERPLWVFVIVLSYSRAMWAELVYEQTVHSLRRSLVRAAVYFGGVTRQWLFDNPKTITLDRHAGSVRFHPQLLDIAGALHVSPRVCTPRSPEQKGKVERAVRYLKERFFAGRTIVSIEQGNDDLLRFLHDIANARPHPRIAQTTVSLAFNEERARLLALPSPLPSTDIIRSVVVDKTASIQFDTNRYSVPPDLVGKTLTLVATDVQLRVVDGDKVVVEHARNWGRSQRIDKREHREAIEKKGGADVRARDHLRASVPSIDVLMRRWLEAGLNVGSHVSRMRPLLDAYGAEALSGAVAEALERGTHDLGAIMQLCETARKKAAKPVALPVAFSRHVRDRDVVAHTLEGYDHD